MCIRAQRKILFYSIDVMRRCLFLDLNLSRYYEKESNNNNNNNKKVFFFFSFDKQINRYIYSEKSESRVCL